MVNPSFMAIVALGVETKSGQSPGTPVDHTDTISIRGLNDSMSLCNSLSFLLILEGARLPSRYRLATVQEVKANQKAVFQAMPGWEIANLADGSVNGKFYGGRTV